MTTRGPMMIDCNGSTPRPIPVGEEPPALEPSPSREPGPATGERSKPKRKTATGQRFKTINTFADFTLAGLDRAEIAVWLLLWRDSRDGIARTSQADLARRAGIAERTVRRAVNQLRQAGLLTLAYRGGLRKGPSAYRVHPLPKN